MKPKKGGSMNNVIKIMDRLVKTSESRNASVEKYTEKMSDKNSMVIALHFCKNKHTFTIPIEADKMDTPLIEYIKEAKSENKAFFCFKAADLEKLKNKTGDVAIFCREADLKVTLEEMKNNPNKFTVRTIYNMCDKKTNHHHISIIVKEG